MVAVLSIADDVRVVATFPLEFHNTFQCVDETGRALWILPGAFITDHGSHCRLAGLQEGRARRLDFPVATRVGDAVVLTGGGVVSAPNETAKPTSIDIKAPRSSRHWTYTNALLAMMKAKGRALDEPIASVVACLSMPMDDDLYAYIHFRAHWDVGVVAIYEAWLDSPPSLVDDRIELGVIANGDLIYVRGRKVIELSHEGDGERAFASFEGWICDVVSRTENPTGLAPFIQD